MKVYKPDWLVPNRLGEIEKLSVCKVGYMRMYYHREGLKRYQIRFTNNV